MEYLSIADKTNIKIFKLKEYSHYFAYNNVEYPPGVDGISKREQWWNNHSTGAYSMLIYTKDMVKHRRLERDLLSKDTKDKYSIYIVNNTMKELETENNPVFYVDDTDILYERNDNLDEIIQQVKTQLNKNSYIEKDNTKEGYKVYGHLPFTYIHYYDCILPQQLQNIDDLSNEFKNILQNKTNPYIQHYHTTYEIDFKLYTSFFEYIVLDNTISIEFLSKIYKKFRYSTKIDSIITELYEDHFIELVQSLDENECIVLHTKKHGDTMKILKV